MAVTLSSLTNVTTNKPALYSWGVVTIGEELFVGSWLYNPSIYVYDANIYTLKRTLKPSSFYDCPIGIIGTDGINLYIKNMNDQIVKIDKNSGATISTNTSAKFSMGNSANFKIDIKNDRLYACGYDNKLNIFTYSTGSLITSYTLPITGYTAGIEIIENQYVIVSCYNINKVYISSIVNNDVANLSFTELYTSTSKISGVAYYNGRLFFGTYSTNVLSGQITGLVEVKYLIQNKINNNIYTLDIDKNVILSPSQIIDEDNYLNNGFDLPLDVSRIMKLKNIDNISNFKLLMYTDNIDINSSILNYNHESYRPVDIADNKFNIIMCKNI